VGNFYGPFDAQDIFDTIEEGDLSIKPVKMDWTFYCKSCRSMASAKTCPHPKEDHIMISGTKLRERRVPPGRGNQKRSIRHTNRILQER